MIYHRTLTISRESKINYQYHVGEEGVKYGSSTGLILKSKNEKWKDKERGGGER